LDSKTMPSSQCAKGAWLSLRFTLDNTLHCATFVESEHPKPPNKPIKS
jgi:hypothetical protein